MFSHKKSVYLLRLEKARKEKLADEGIMHLVETINNRPGFYTTSSCAGRSVISESKENDNKKEHAWLGKWHRKVSEEEVKKAISKNHETGVFWFRFEPLILHVCCRTDDDADLLLKCAKAAGLKRSGITQLTPRIMVEVIGVDNICAPIFREIDDKLIEKLVAAANTRFDKNSKKTSLFAKEIETRHK